MAITEEDLQLTLATLQPATDGSGDMLNRLCVVISDVHFTDGTVGTQSAEETVWADFFADLANTCDKQHIDQLTLVLDGDVVDMIRTSAWAEAEVYPWQRNDPKFKEKFKQCLHKIMDGILCLHDRPPEKGEQSGGFFYHLKDLPKQLLDTKTDTDTAATKVEVLVLLGNHDKEIFADPEVLRRFYEDGLGQPLSSLKPEYRAWIGNMYFGDADRFKAADSVPWLPFYWGDADLRLFLTHGQWRDRANCLAIAAADGLPGWNTKDGWAVKTWQKLNYRPFTEACFGDTVAAGVLSTFICRSKKALQKASETPNATPPDLTRINRILDELDLYRPSSAAVSRILQETGRSSTDTRIRDIIENQLFRALKDWLNWDYTLASAPSSQRLGLTLARYWLKFTESFLMYRIQLQFVRGVLKVLDWLEQIRPSSVYSEDGASLKNLLAFPTFQEALLKQGFQIHGEGHTHIPLQAEADIDSPTRKNFTYVNFGAWRDQIVDKENGGYRRRGIGRALYVLNLQKQSEYRYFVRDNLNWSDRMDKLD
ncbi:hypothetical protein [Methylomonas koyamae]|uniref:Uncharacterized protein n=1 Tax=Methylomonas koyamae TaxID=702114 RepID=A0A291IPR4_9GAMM|nr:hypothetical protein [Methylomonas koyamae]ATG92243.1 hypothetical protein MKLM6_4069 [Methylomonas koyamae]OAI25015.1 hypothetical protein A1356_14675 [Methylomonas koyamae]